MKPEPNKKPATEKQVARPDAERIEASPFEIAQLAALIDPQPCRSGNARDAILRAIALFEESVDVCALLAAKKDDILGRFHLLTYGALGGSDGANRLANVYRQRANNAHKSVLTLDTGANTDTCRTYLAEHLNLEGTKKQQPPWKSARTVLENLRLMAVDIANAVNKRNVDSIREEERLIAEEAQRLGCSVEKLRATRFITWQDGAFTYDYHLTRWRNAYFERCGGTPDCKEGCFDIPPIMINELIMWKRDKRVQRGGIRSLRQLTREEILQEPVK